MPVYRRSINISVGEVEMILLRDEIPILDLAHNEKGLETSDLDLAISGRQ